MDALSLCSSYLVFLNQRRGSMFHAAMFADGEGGAIFIGVVFLFGFVAYQGFKFWLLMNKPDSYAALMQQQRQRRDEKWGRAFGGVGLFMKIMGRR
jgi:hypothetical protein